MSGGNEKPNKQNSGDNLVYSGDEENVSERPVEEYKVSERCPSQKFSDASSESGIVTSSGESSDIHRQLSFLTESKGDTKGSKLNDFACYMSSKIRAKSSQHGEGSYQPLEDKSHFSKEKESKPSKTYQPTSGGRGFMRKVQAGMKIVGDLIPSKNKESLMETVKIKHESPTVKEKSPLNLLKRSKKRGATKKDRMKMVRELSDSSEAETSEVTQISIVPDSDHLYKEDLHSEDDVESI